MPKAYGPGTSNKEHYNQIMVIMISQVFFYYLDPASMRENIVNSNRCTQFSLFFKKKKTNLHFMLETVEIDYE